MHPRDAVRRLALGRALSGTGSGIAGVALSYLICERTGSAVWLAGTLFFTFGVTGFLTPLAGKIAGHDARFIFGARRREVHLAEMPCLVGSCAFGVDARRPRAFRVTIGRCCATRPTSR